MEPSKLGSDDKSLSMTLIEMPTPGVSNAIDAILTSWRSINRFRREETDSLSDLDEMEPVPGGAHLFKLVLFSPATNPDSSVLITNLVDGWHSLAHMLAKSIKCLELQLLSTTNGVAYPRNSFEIWRNGDSQRIVQALRDSDRWQFFELGKPESFELTERYKLRLIKARLTRELLLQYAAALGWSITDAEFARPNGKVVTYAEKRKGS